ncbi:tRNA lysidine(34) synthetase TilS [Prevotella sp. P5-92]|uniref:tRNA lysidine(34) synthetase TilS n=1 Tax=Prevotella sp. P5-92 TaxID=2024222 RepID=UPI000B971450|nr:tRNA lysidine(34) synthetase TilS [Prevotella sp. P5-92]OYP59482.1 tRNA lysidine(34) synthetase TilS [Prevotella sp. P5-92]
MLNKKILDRDKLYLVAISGGADSVALLMMMLDEGYRVEAVHCNFHLRGEEADRDEAFVAGLCERFGVALHRVHFDTRGYAALHKLSIETAARDLRYGYFERLREDIGAEAIVVAHHRDDNVETVLMNLVRGTGLKGLAGIRPVNGRVIRPLLDMTREDIEAYIYKRGESFVTDSTNLETDATRNKYRLEVIPALKEINPSVARAIDTTARHLQDADEIVEWALEKMKADVMEEGDDGVVRIDTTLLRQLPAPRYVLFEICRQYGFLPQQSNVVWAMMEHGEKGKTVASTEYEMASEHNLLLVARKEEIPQPVRMPIEGLYVMNGRRLRIELKKADGFAVVKSKSVACLDAKTVTFPLVVRPWKSGDRFAPFGMRGTKLVSDYLTDCKLNFFQRRRQLVVEDATGLIVWLVGERTSEKCRVGEKTETVIVLRME